jgi:succinate dehydrogenase / fumarate reductase, iron-sulfur subunit
MFPLTAAQPPKPNNIPVCKNTADKAFDAATCIGCGACVAACKNSSAMLFVAAKVYQLSILPQGKLEAKQRVENDECYGCRRFWQLFQHLCLRSRVPERDFCKTIARMNAEYLTAKVADYADAGNADCR